MPRRKSLSIRFKYFKLLAQASRERDLSVARLVEELIEDRYGFRLDTPDQLQENIHRYRQKTAHARRRLEEQTTHFSF